MKRPNKTSPASPRKTPKSPALAKAPTRITQRDLEHSVLMQISRRRRFRRLTATFTVLAFLVLTTLVLIATFSPALAITKIEVLGTKRIDGQQIQNALKNQLGTPLPLFREEEVADSLSGFELIESFSALAAPPNTLQIIITERVPICVINVKGTDFLFDAAGVRLGKATAFDQLPKILISEDPRGSTKFSNAISVLLALPVKFIGQIDFIEAKSKDDVEMKLNNPGGQRVVWGDSSNPVLKAKVLEALMKNHGKTRSLTFDVSSPNSPVVRYSEF